MSSLCKSALGLWLIALWSGTSVSVQAQTTANGPYYATPSWDLTLPSATRFIVLSNFNGEAVLDRETGLVWEKSPATGQEVWFEAAFACIQKIVGGRKGWRLPSVHELASLVDPSQVASGFVLPTGHPFVGIQAFFYWSATSIVALPDSAWHVGFRLGNVTAGLKSEAFHVWCVRGGGVLDSY